MVKTYLLEPGFVEDTVLYEVKLVEVKRMSGVTADQIANILNDMGVKRLVIDAGYPPLIERLRQHFLIKKIIKFGAKPKPSKLIGEE